VLCIETAREIGIPRTTGEYDSPAGIEDTQGTVQKGILARAKHSQIILEELFSPERVSKCFTSISESSDDILHDCVGGARLRVCGFAFGAGSFYSSRITCQKASSCKIGETGIAVLHSLFSVCSRTIMFSIA